MYNAFRPVVFSSALVMLCSGAVAAPGDWTGTAELGLLVTTGDTEETNLKGGLNLTRDADKWRNQIEAASLYSKSEDTTTAERYRLSAQADYKFSERQFWFIRGAYDDDRFSGYQFQSSASAGYGNRVWQRGEASFLELSAGLGYRYDKLEETDDDGNDAEDEAIARLAGRFDYELTPTSLFRQTLATEIGLADNTVISVSETSIQADFLTDYALKAGYRVEHNSDAPAGSESVNTEASFTMLYTF